MHSSYYVMTVFSATIQFFSATFLQPRVPLQPVLLCPHHYRHVLVRAKLPWKEEDAAAPAQRCSISSAVLSAPDAEQPYAIPAQGALHPSYGRQGEEEAGPSAPFLLRMLGSSCCGGQMGY